jgi:PTH1 family peptidyl-tRNA hydrolase
MLFGKSGGAVSYILVFLGNPGIKYNNTRHNAGFMAADAFAAREGVKIDRLKYRALTQTVDFGGEKTLVMMPQTMMNLSGTAVSQAASFFKVPPARIIVVYDDVSLPVGKIRVRPSGSAGGHNGMKDIIARVGSDRIPRVKIGVGEKPREDYDLAAWVLGNMSHQDRKTIEDALPRALDAAECIVTDGCDAAMSRFNG